MSDAATLYILTFANNQIVVAPDINIIEYMAPIVIQDCGHWRLKINIDKRKYL